MKILLFGKNGQVGWELQRALAPLGELVALDSYSSGALHGDFRKPEALAATVRRVAPQWIVNAAAYTAVDQAELEPGLARTVNAQAPAVLAREAKAHGAWLLHYSSDHVFDGSGHTPWDEASPTAALNIYGATKLAGEQAIAASGCLHLILRTSWVYAARGHNFALTMLRLAATRDRLEVVDDQIGAPTSAALLADLSAHALRSIAVQPGLAGTYHAVAAGETSRHAYAQFLIEQARKAGIPSRVAADAIVAVPSTHIAGTAIRPKNSRMDTRKLQRCFNLSLPDWRDGVIRLVQERHPVKQ